MAVVRCRGGNTGLPLRPALCAEDGAWLFVGERTLAQTCERTPHIHSSLSQWHTPLQMPLDTEHESSTKPCQCTPFSWQPTEEKRRPKGRKSGHTNLLPSMGPSCPPPPPNTHPKTNTSSSEDEVIHTGLLFALLGGFLFGVLHYSLLKHTLTHKTDTHTYIHTPSLSFPPPHSTTHSLTQKKTTRVCFSNTV